MRFISSTPLVVLAAGLTMFTTSGCLRDSGNSSPTDKDAADSPSQDGAGGDVGDVSQGDLAGDDAPNSDSSVDGKADALPGDQLDQDVDDTVAADVSTDQQGDQAALDTQPEVVLPPCAPGPACTAVASPTCISLVDNSGKAEFSMRLASFVPSQPAALASGIVNQLLQSSAAPSLAACNLMGSGTFTVLLKFSGTQLTLGGAAPVADPTKGYSFLNQMINGVQVAPNTAQFDTLLDGIQSQAMDVILPFFLDMAGTQVILIPLRGAVISAKLSEDQNCIGAYNAEGLDPANSCLPDDTHPLFLAGGQLTAAISLEDADTIVVDALSQSLCVVLGGAPTPEPGVKHCVRDANGAIVFKGDWCSATNSAGGCGDAMLMKVEFAASGVKLL